MDQPANLGAGGAGPLGGSRDCHQGVVGARRRSVRDRLPRFLNQRPGGPSAELWDVAQRAELSGLAKSADSKEYSRGAFDARFLLRAAAESLRDRLPRGWPPIA